MNVHKVLVRLVFLTQVNMVVMEVEVPAQLKGYANVVAPAIVAVAVASKEENILTNYCA